MEYLVLSYRVKFQGGKQRRYIDVGSRGRSQLGVTGGKYTSIKIQQNLDKDAEHLLWTQWSWRLC